MRPNCTQCYSDEPSKHCMVVIEVDADIAGIGILVAFFLSALATCLTILFGYLGDSLPRSLLSSTDEAVIQAYRETFLARKLIPRFGRLWMCLKAFFYRCARRGPSRDQPALSRERRVEATTRFLLGLSDQQLVTGLAILIAGLVNRSQLTLYELQIVFCLAWFSATTHGATLLVLREYFYDHAVVRDWRVLGISAFTVLLCFFQVILILAGDPQTTDGVDYGRPVQCIISGQSRRESFDFFDIFNEAYMLFFLLFFYVPSTLALYEDPRSIPLPGPLSTLWLRPTFDSKDLHNRLSTSNLLKLRQNVALQYDIVAGSRLPVQLWQFSRGWSRYSNSFLSRLPVVTFSITFGVAQTIVVTWIIKPRTTDEVQKMSFGQVVAITLLAIPLLTGAEIYNETRKSHTENALKLERSDEDAMALQYLSPELAEAEYQQREQALGATYDAHHLFKVAHQAISKELSKQVGIEELSPMRRHLVVYSSLDEVLGKIPHCASATRRNKIGQYKARIPTKAISAVDFIVQIFGAVTLNTGGIPGIVGPFLLGLWAIFQAGYLVDVSHDVRGMMESQLQFLQRNRDWLEEHHGPFMDVDDRLLFLPEESRVEESGTDVAVELDAISLRRQDTEADVGVILRRPTDKTV